jgi:3-dehydroquinate synthase
VKKIKIKIRRDAAPYEVVIAGGILRESGRRIAGQRPTLTVVVTSPTVRKLWGVELERSLQAARLRYAILELPDGEKHKSLGSTERLLRGFLSAGADRKSVVVAFGGGVVGDTAGFAASVFMRGVPMVQIPTTVLAQVDASIGGKTGVNLKEGKNLVGTFHQPKLVLIDPELLSTLPAREFRAGLFEAIKCGVVRDAELFRYMEANRVALFCQHKDALEKVISAAVKVKAEVVSADERESGLRRILNFGHTVGHALEAESGYRRFLHGEAVAWGMVAAAEIGVNTGIMRSGDAERLIDLIMAYGPLPSVKANVQAVLKLLKVDKKSVAGVPHFVLASRIGAAKVVSGIAPDIIRAAVEGIGQS